MNQHQLDLTTELKYARGSRFVKLLKQTYSCVSPELVTDARQIISDTGKLSTLDVATLANRYNLSLKHCFDFLEDPIDQVLPFGTYLTLLARGLKPNEVMQKVTVKVNN